MKRDPLIRVVSATVVVTIDGRLAVYSADDDSLACNAPGVTSARDVERLRQLYVEFEAFLVRMTDASKAPPTAKKRAKEPG